MKHKDKATLLQCAFAGFVIRLPTQSKACVGAYRAYLQRLVLVGVGLDS